MRIAFFIGALGSENDGIYGTLRRNAGVFAQRGVMIPEASKYRQALRELVEARAPQSQVGEQVRALRAQMLGEGPEPERLVLATPNFLGTAHQTFNALVLPDGAMRLAYLASLFPEDEIELYFAMVNPALFVPNLMQIGKARSYTFFLKGVEPSDIPWSEILERLMRPISHIPLTTWANEDSALMWGTLLRRILGVGDDVTVLGEYDLLMPLLTTTGQSLLLADPRTQMPLDHTGRVALAVEYLQQYVDLSQIDVEVGVENWDQPYVDRLTAYYESDLKRVAALKGVELLEA